MNPKHGEHPGMQPPPPGFVPSHGFAPPPTYSEASHTSPIPPNPPLPNAGQIIFVTRPAPTFGPDTTTMTCPHCQQHISTRVMAETSTKTHLFALLLCIICVPCGLLPYCMDSCMTKKHYCPSCTAYLGQYEN